MTNLILPGAVKDRELYQKLLDLSLDGAVYLAIEFNTDTQVYDIGLRYITIEDI